MTTLQDLRPKHGKALKKNRLPGVIFVIVFHIAAIWALAAGLANKTIELLRGNVKAVVTTEVAQEDLPPPPPPCVLSEPSFPAFLLQTCLPKLGILSSCSTMGRLAAA